MWAHIRFAIRVNRTSALTKGRSVVLSHIIEILQQRSRRIYFHFLLKDYDGVGGRFGTG